MGGCKTTLFSLKCVKSVLEPENRHKYNKNVHNPGQNNCHKVKIPSKIGQYQKYLISAFVQFLAVITINLFIERALDAICPLDLETLFFPYFLDPKFQILEATPKCVSLSLISSSVLIVVNQTRTKTL